jgi:hypothetical protein
MRYGAYTSVLKFVVDHRNGVLTALSERLMDLISDRSRLDRWPRVLGRAEARVRVGLARVGARAGAGPDAASPRCLRLAVGVT